VAWLVSKLIKPTKYFVIGPPFTFNMPVTAAKFIVIVKVPMLKEDDASL
jgi:hypothetical protein